MSDRNPFFVFDWLFSDASNDAARRFALLNRPKETEVLMDLMDADSLVHYSLWEELPKSHPVGELWLESQPGLLATIYLAYGGFFRQALIVLRSWFEDALHGVYFSEHYGQPTEKYEQWRKGRREAPVKIHDFVKSLASRTDKVIQVDETTLRNHLEPIYDFLSEQTHGQGLDVYELQAERDNVPRFLPKSFDLWFEKTLAAFDEVCFLYQVFFPQPLISYFKEAPGDASRLQQVQTSLSKLMPSFGKLAEVILNTRC